ncbi:MAG TPA: cupin-like domain-containing protein [Candidatus Methylacidiphilales bacterium]
MNSLLTAPNEVQNRVSTIVTEIPPDQQARMRNFQSFCFNHSLAHYPALTLAGVRELTAQLIKENRLDQIFYHVDRTKVPGNGTDPRDALSIFNSFDTADAWLRLTRVDEINADMKQVSETFYSDLSRLFGRDIRKEVMKTFVTLFISSPNKVTKYHIDHTWNFLLQIVGRKTVHLYDATDPRVLRQEDRENWYMRQETDPFFQPENDGPRIAYDLPPGVGVHHPVNAPHWVQNGPEASISLSFGLCLHASNEDARVYQANFMLRKLGLDPVPPRQSPWRDAMKIRAVKLFAKRNPNSFEDVVYSGVRPLRAVYRAMRIARVAR